MFGIEETEGVLTNGLEAVVKVARGLVEEWEASSSTSPPPSPEPFRPTVGFFTFSSSCIRFYSYKPETGEVATQIVTDVKDSPFAAMPATQAGFDVSKNFDSLLDLVSKVRGGGGASSEGRKAGAAS